MPINTLPTKLFGLKLQVWNDQVADRIPRTFNNSFNVYGAKLGAGGASFLLALAKEPPTVVKARRLCESLARIDPRPTAIHWAAMDLGMMNALATEGVAYIRDEQNAYLPFLGSAISSHGILRQPKVLSPQAQRIVLNLVANRWNMCTAGDLAGLTGKSPASVTKYLAEIEAIAPGLVANKGRLRTLSNAGHTKEELLRGFANYLSDPADTIIPLRHALSIEAVQQAGGLLSGESALAFVSDLAPSRTTTVAIHKEALTALKAAAGETWQKAAWYESAEMAVEVWGYQVDAPSDESVASSGLSSIDALNLYVACSKRESNNVRYLDAVEQLREQICR